MEFLLDLAHKSVFVMQVGIAIAGVWFFLLVLVRTRQKRFKNRAESDLFLTAVAEELKTKNFDGVAKLCDSPRYWSKAVPQLILVSLEQRMQKLGKIKRILAERFELDVVADLENCLSWLGTVAKAAPMLGLLGTTLCMINAFAKIGDSSQAAGTDPAKLAEDISFALAATCFGLLIAIPAIMAANYLQIRINKLQDAVQRDLNVYFEDFEPAVAGAASRRSA